MSPIKDDWLRGLGERAGRNAEALPLL